ncbi:hypothetical protein HK405_015939, partial [Cladochytrium tenue]
TRTTEDIVLEEKRRSLRKRLNPNKALRRVDRDPDEPEKPKNAYMLFFVDVASGKMPTLQGDVFSQPMNQTDRLKAIAQTWKTMSDEQKAPYNHQAKLLKQEYDEKYQVYLQNSGRQDFVDSVNVIMRKEKKKKGQGAGGTGSTTKKKSASNAAAAAAMLAQPMGIPGIAGMPGMIPTGLGQPGMHMTTVGPLPLFSMEQVLVITYDGRIILGTLKGYDQTTNLILAKAVERQFSATEDGEEVPLGLYIVRGPNV